MTAEPAWRKYEREIHTELTSLYREASIRHDVKLPGSLSGTTRQIDILVEEDLRGGRVATAIDAKHHSRPIDVKDVEAFVGLLRDVRLNRGIMISASGYSEAALARAFHDDIDLDLDVVTLDDFKCWEAAGAIPYAGRHAVLLPAPLGWVINAERSPGALARLHRRGLTFVEAARRNEFMYINIWDRCPPVDNLDALLAHQESNVRKISRDTVISVREVAPSVHDVAAHCGWRACIRRADIPNYSTAEITGFVEFPDTIFFAVLFTPLVVERRNVRKLEYILMKALPMSVRHATQQTASPDGRG